MPRPVWSGTISFGLVTIPVKLFHAVSRKNVSFNQLDDRSMSRIRMKKVSAETGEDVPDEHIVKGYEVAKGRYVVVDPDELEPFIPAATKAIDLEEFVDLAEIDPVFFDTPYIVAPDNAAKPYMLLTKAMEDSGKVAVGTFVMRSKQYVAALRPVDGRLMLSTMAFADEVVDPATIDDGWGGVLGWFWVACAVTTVVLLFVTRAALREREYSAVMAATGLLYLAILTAFGTDLVARAVLA